MTHKQITELLMNMTDDKLLSMNKEIVAPYLGGKLHQRYWVLQADYGFGHGWEDICAEKSRTEIKQRLKEYRENEGGTYRIVTRREQ